MAPTAIPNPQVTSVVVNIPPPSPVFDRDSGILLVEAPDVPPDFEASVNGEVVQDNDSLIGENIVTGEHQSSDGSTVSDSLFANDSTVDGGPVVGITDLSLLLVHEIQLLVDEEISKYTIPWRGSLPLRVYPMREKEVLALRDDRGFDWEPEVVDICDYFVARTQDGKEAITRLYFPPSEFPPPQIDDGGKEVFATPSFLALKAHILLASHDGESPVVMNGGRPKGEYRDRRFVCQIGYRKTRTNQGVIQSDDNLYRGGSFISDRKGNVRNRGKKLIRKTKTNDVSFICNFKFAVRCDFRGYYIYIGNHRGRSLGKCLHCGHGRVDGKTFPMSCQLLSGAEKQNIVHISTSSANKTSGRNYVFSKYGRFLNGLKAAYIVSKESSGGREGKDDVIEMMDSLESSDDVIFTALSNVPLSYFENEQTDTDAEGSVSLSVTKTSDGSLINTDISEDPHMKPIADMMEKSRQTLNVDPNQSIFFSIAWIQLPSIRFFKLCPEVIWMDITSHSNNKGFHLLTFSCRTSIDKQVVFLWIWISNQQRSSFRWVFQHAIPTLIPAYHRSRVHLIMKDGDAQQRNEVLGSLKTVFQNASEAGCGWHIVNQGWRVHVPSLCIVGEKNDKWQKVVRKIKNWMYSWMRPGFVESDMEYKISKHLLLCFVKSQSVRVASDNNHSLIERIIKFVVGHVLVHEMQYLHYRRSHIRHFDAAHASAHEGTNNGMKTHTSSMKATMTMNNSAMTLCLQSNLKACELEEIVSNDYLKSQKLWSKSPTAKHVTTYAEGIIVSIYKRRDSYKTIRVGERSFEVHYVGEDGRVEIEDSKDYDAFHTPLPLFKRVRRVNVDEDGTMLCSCQRFETTGIFCSHQDSVAFAVSTELGRDWEGFSKHDVAVRWWTSFMYFAYKQSTPENLLKMFHSLASNDMKGPVLRGGIPSSMTIFRKTADEDALDRLKNYDKDRIHLDDSDYAKTSTHFPMSFSQEDEDDLFFDSNMPGAEEMFDSSINDTSFPSLLNVDARSSLRGLVNESFGIADNLGHDGKTKLKEVLLSFIAWGGCQQKEKTDDSEPNTKRSKVVTFCQDPYTGSLARHKNTLNY